MALEIIKKEIVATLKIDEKDLVYPPNKEMGDLSYPLFKAVKKGSESPLELGVKLKEQLLQNKNLMKSLDKIENAGPYLNFFVKSDLFISELVSDIFSKKNKYGFNDSGKKEVSIFEFSNANTHKDIHVGHIRNIALGDSIFRIYEANGYKSYPISYINDFGIHTAKVVWSYKQKFSRDLGKCYVHAVKEMEDKPDLAKEIGQIMADIESRQGENYKAWKKTRAISLSDFSKIFKQLNIKFKKIYFESEVIDKGLEMVEDFIEKGIMRKSEGAIIADLEKYNLGILPVIRGNGTALYPVADLALAAQKFKDFKNLKNSYIVVDVRQSLHFKQLFKVLSLAGYKQNFAHLPYDFVTLPEGMMSSRSGNSISYYEAYEKIFQKLVEESRKRHSNWSNKKIKKNSELLTTDILKFEMLKVSPQKIIVFNVEEATKFDGFSALYILYGLVRIKSIIKKHGRKVKYSSSLDFSKLDSVWEKNLAIKLSKYPEVVKKAGSEFDPSEIAKYLFELYKLFNDYYQNVKVLSSEGESKKVRLVFMSAISVVSENALGLLGLKSLKEI
jgi:arginyl-tRNA synthetase